MAAASPAVIVETARNNILAGSGFAVDRDVNIRRSQRGYQSAHFLDLQRSAKQACFDSLAVRQGISQQAHLQGQPSLFDCPAHHRDELL